MIKKILKSIKSNTSKNLIELNNIEAKNYFLRSESYCNFDLPSYFNFNKFLKNIQNFNNTDIDFNLVKKDPVNFVIYNNKDGKYAWRKFQLIHPIFYLRLVDIITEKSNWEYIVKHFKDNTTNNIKPTHIVTKNKINKSNKKDQILRYFENIECKSIEMSLKYSHIVKLDITDCYPSIYVHSITWALHGKNCVKSMFKSKTLLKNLLGNKIENEIMNMQARQTNGIPQGSVLMDFIAEILLVHIDKIIETEIEKDFDLKDKYYILRYRDDYRIFSNNKSISEKIIKVISEVLMEYNLKLNTSKTEISDDVILDSIKKDKIDNIIYHLPKTKELDVYKLKRLLLDLLYISNKYPNSGFVLKMLQHFLDRDYFKYSKVWYRNNQKILIAIVVNLAEKNPRSFDKCCNIFSQILSKTNKKEIIPLCNDIFTKLNNINNIGFNEIWLQRAFIKLDIPNINFRNDICKIISKYKWDSLFDKNFIKNESVKTYLDKNNFIDTNKLNKISKVMKTSETDVFDIYE